jgi:BirA family biotin operon repressor/biotin-[acetyl-CoA-carboxylase] ligase
MQSDFEILNLSLDLKILQPQILHTEQISSTNTYFLQDHSHPNGTVLLADYQTGGKGRHGRVWHSPPGQALLFSILLTRLCTRVFLHIYTFLAAVAVYEGLELFGIGEFKLDLKWPNDVLLEGRKLCGILVQNRLIGNETSQIVIGIGINVNQPANYFIGGLNQGTSLNAALGKSVDRIEVLKQVLVSLDRWLFILGDSGETAIFNRWKAFCGSIGKKVLVNDGQQIYTGIFKDLSSQGGLVLEADGHYRVFYAADVTLTKETDYVGCN